MNLYPWLEEPYKQLAKPGRRLPHALLLTGMGGIGKLLLARELAQTLLCDQRKVDMACGDCTGCRLFAAGNHPDYHLLTSEEQEGQGDPNVFGPAARYLDEPSGRAKGRINLRRIIGVDQVRALTRELDMTPHLGVSKVIVIFPANQMNLNAANALLKVLEEPTTDTYFLLVTAFPYTLPPTIRSRCAHLRVHAPDEGAALSWICMESDIDTERAKILLHIAVGSPLRAIQLQDSAASDLYVMLPQDLHAIVEGETRPGEISGRWGEADIRVTIAWLQWQMFGAIRAGRGGNVIQAASTLFSYLGRERCFALYEDLGIFLQWPAKAIDEILFLESVVMCLFEPQIEFKAGGLRSRSLLR